MGGKVITNLLVELDEVRPGMKLGCCFVIVLSFY